MQLRSTLVVLPDLLEYPSLDKLIRQRYETQFLEDHSTAGFRFNPN